MAVHCPARHRPEALARSPICPAAILDRVAVTGLVPRAVRHPFDARVGVAYTTLLKQPCEIVADSSFSARSTVRMRLLTALYWSIYDMVNSATPKLGEHAVVVGPNMGGVLAARVLADLYGAVTVAERNVVPADPLNRRGVPQGRKAHVLLARCWQILGELFPGLLDKAVAGGVSVWDGDCWKVNGSVGGHQLAPPTTTAVREVDN